jgi:hypothetical protein
MASLTACWMIDYLEERKKQRQLDFKNAKEATKRLSQLEGAMSEKLGMGMLDRLREELNEGDRVFKRLGGIVHSDEMLRALTKVQNTLNKCIEIVRVAIRGERSPTGERARMTQWLAKSHQDLRSVPRAPGIFGKEA